MIRYRAAAPVAVRLIDFFRVEGEDRSGPYREECWPHFDSWDKERHPGPFMDNLGYVSAGEVFGFTSLEALRAWFDGASLSILVTHEMSKPFAFRIAHYTVAEDFVRHGGKQSVAYRSALELVKEIDIQKLLDETPEG